MALSGTGAANFGVECRLLTPFDRLEPISVETRLRLVRANKWRRSCRDLIADDGPPSALRTAVAASMDLLPHQLEPALAIVRGHGTRLLIADDVGLGKTVQAGLVIAELYARGAATRALILTPAGLREQWVDELKLRFDLQPVVMDMREARRKYAALPVGVNPWSTESMVVASLDYIKRPEVLPAVRDSRWDIVVVDEAHHVGSGNDRHSAVASLCERAAYVVLLTATPHSGDTSGFERLCAIGEHDDELLVFRRTRAEVVDHRARRIHQLHVRANDHEQRMHACLTRFTEAVEREHAASDPNVSLALATLRKRAFSSAFALQRTVERRLTSVALGDRAVDLQLALPFDDGNGELDAADAPPSWTVPALADLAEEQQLLERLLEAARLAATQESKLSALARLLRRLREPAIVFTEYRDTLVHLHHAVAPEASVIHGGLSRDERRDALAAFSRGAVLLATDAAGEGLNLHHHCRLVINLELPWNPMRLEQRIGRVDRIGQRRRVHVFHLIAAATGELDILDRLISRITSARLDIGAPDPLSTRPASIEPHNPLAGRVDGVKTAPCRSLSSEAASEHTRLMRARRLFTGAKSRLEGTDVALTTSRRRKVRVGLGGRVLALFQTTAVQQTGKIVASHVTPVLIDVDGQPARWWRELEGLDVLPHDQTYGTWMEETQRLHRVFWNARLVRETAIALAIHAGDLGGLQPGLFDRRAELQRLREGHVQRQAILESQLGMNRAEESSVLTINRPQPVLILVPCRHARRI